MGKRAGQRDQERFLKAKMNVGAQVPKHHNFAKGGICRSGTKILTQITQGLGEERLAVPFTASGLLYSLLETLQCDYPSLSPGAGVFESQRWHYLG